jgi:2-polyprenyl-6-methoxyphenol hydroxylase-like FAD-dependent oxidoreductase
MNPHRSAATSNVGKEGARMMRAPRIAIVGGGVGGLAAALALERRGAEIVVCEQSPALSDIGADLNLSTR